MKLGDRIKGVPLLRSRDAYSGKCEWVERKHPVEGMYIGYRTYANGERHGGYNYDDPYYFVPKGYIKVALLVRDERSKPEAVLFDKAQVITQ